MSQQIAYALFSDLRSSDPAIRFTVLTRIESISWTNELKVAFSVLAEAEADPATRLHMQLILARVSPDRAKAIPPDRIQAELERLAGDPAQDPIRFVLLLEGLTREQGPAAVLTLKDHHWEAYPVEVLPFVLRFLRKFGTPDLVPKLEGLCRHPNPRILAAAVEALERLAPESLQSLIVPLLTNPNYEIRSRAIKVLYKWDPEEALRHFEGMLFSEDPQDRHAAMFHAYFFPFDRIEPLLLRFLGAEDDPTLLTRAGYLFQVNPTPDPPLALLEVMEGCLGGKQQVLGGILKGVLEAQGKFLQAKPQELLEQLKTSYRTKKARELIEQCRLQWPSADDARREDILGRLRDLHQKGYEEAASLLKFLTVRPVPPSGLHTPEPDLTKTPLSALAADRRLDMLKTSPDLVVTRFSEIEGVWDSLTVPEKVLILRELGTRKMKSPLGRLAVPALEAADVTLATAAVDTLADIDPDLLFPHLPKLIRHPQTEVQIAAIRVYSLYDKKEALRLLDRLLAAPLPAARATAIFHLARFDFPSVKEMLLGALRRETDADNLTRIAAILTSNAEERLAGDVYRIANSATGDLRTILDRMVEQVCQALLGRGKTTAGSLVALIERFRTALAEEQKQVTAAPAYSVANIQKLRQQQAAGRPIAPGSRKPLTSSEDENLLAFGLQAFFGMGFAALLIWFLALSHLLPAVPEAPIPPARPTTPALPPGERIIEGKVLSTDAEGFVVEPLSGGEPLLIRNRSFPQGSTLKIRIRSIPPVQGKPAAEIVETY